MQMASFRTLGLTGAIFALGVGAAAGQTGPPPPARVGVAVRTLVPFPFGIDVAVPVNPKINVRVGLNLFKLTHDFDDDGITNQIAAGRRPS